MKIVFSPILAALLLATSPMAVLAQTVAAPAADAAPADAAPADAATDAPAADAPAADIPADAAPAADASADAGPQVGQPYIRDNFGDWSLRCLKAEAGQPDPCQLYQLLKDADGNAVAEFSTFPLPEGQQAAAGATVVVPLETLLTQQLRLTVDKGEAKLYPFTFCNAAGCVARIGFTAEELAQLKRGNGAVLRMVPAAAPDQEVLLNISLSGFTVGFDSVNEQ
jgi:invasion protein IalB